MLLRPDYLGQLVATDHAAHIVVAAVHGAEHNGLQTPFCIVFAKTPELSAVLTGVMALVTILQLFQHDFLDFLWDFEERDWFCLTIVYWLWRRRSSRHLSDFDIFFSWF